MTNFIVYFILILRFPNKVYRYMLYKPFGRLLIGICQVLTACYFVSLSANHDLLDRFMQFSQDIIGEQFIYSTHDETGHLTTAATLGGAIYIVLGLILIVYTFRGLYKIMTWRTGPLAIGNTDHAWAEVKDGSFLQGTATYGEGPYQGINRILEYSNCKNSMLPRDKAAKNALEISGALNVADARTLEYIDAKVSMMPRDKGLEFLKGHK